MPALEFSLSNATAPGAAAPAATTIAAGNSFTVKAFDPVDPTTGQPVQAHLVSMWAKTQAAGLLRIRSPLMHDLTQGIRTRFPSATPLPVLPQGLGFDQPLKSQDNLIVEMQGSAVGGQIEEAIWGIYYENLPGVKANFIDPQTLHLRCDQISGNEVQLAPGATGGWSGQVAINSFQQTINANRSYAILGATFDVLSAAVRIQGTDTGSLGVAIPGIHTMPQFTSQWFVHLSNTYGVGMIPVINGSNAGNTFIDCAQDQAGAAVKCTLILARLK